MPETVLPQPLLQAARTDLADVLTATALCRGSDFQSGQRTDPEAGFQLPRAECN